MQQSKSDFKTPENQTVTMPEDGEIHVQTDIDEEVWEELVDFIEEHKSVRRHSKKFYANVALKMALVAKRNYQDSGMDDILEDI